MSCNGITHEQQVYCLACDVAMYALNHERQAFIDAAATLARLVNKDDMQRAKELKREHVTKCGCALCKLVLSAMDKEEETTPPSDESFAV